MSKKVYIKKEEVSFHRNSWASIAKNNGWYTEPFFIQVWVDKKGIVVDSVCYRNMEKDIYVFNDTDKMIKDQAIIFI